MAQLRKTCKDVISEEYGSEVMVEWIPIEWHSLLHDLNSVDARMNKVNLPTCSILRMVNNDFLADVLYYFTSFHGQAIVDFVTEALNKAYTSFRDANVRISLCLIKKPNFSGKCAIFGHRYPFSLCSLI